MYAWSNSEKCANAVGMHAQTSEQFGEDLKKRRELAGLSKTQLAQLSGLTRGTIDNLERGRHKPSPDTFERLAKVKALRYVEPEQPRRHETHLSPTYSPLDMAIRLQNALNSTSGATLDQAMLYVEPQSVLDWVKYCTDANYQANYRDRIPSAEVASKVARLAEETGIDVVALGSGDGRSEVRLVAHLLSTMRRAVHLDLVDVSHPLLITAYRHAVDVLAQHGTRVHPIHADFYDLRSYDPLTYRNPGDLRKRLWTLLGHTLGNLRDELLFLRELAGISRPGDLLVLDCQTTEFDAEAEIRANDRLLQGAFSELLTNWLLGPLRRHLALTELPKITPILSQHCSVPGSYSVTLTATVHKAEHKPIEWNLARFKRYMLSRLEAALDGIGWKTLSSYGYGPQQKCGLLLLQRKDSADDDSSGPESTT